MRDKALFVRIYGELTLELPRVDYRPYRLSNHALFICTKISQVEHARYDVPYAQELGTCNWNFMCHWDQCYMRNWKEYKP